MAGSLQTLVFVILVMVLIAFCQLCYWFFSDSDRGRQERGQWWTPKESRENGTDVERRAVRGETRDTLPLAYSGPG